MTASVADRFRLLRRDVNDYGGDTYAEALELLSELAREVPLVGEMTTRNFNDILTLLQRGERVEPTQDEHERVVDRGLDKRAPFHRSKNSVADALIIEMYASQVASAVADDRYALVTSNSDDFSLPNGDARLPHPDLAELFPDGSQYGLGVEGLESVLREHFVDWLDELMDAPEIDEEPRRLDAIIEAQSELFDRLWYHRSLQLEYRVERSEGAEGVARLLKIAGEGRRRVEAKYTEPGQLGPYSDFELGMLNGKLSALRWVLGSEWDFLDT